MCDGQQTRMADSVVTLCLYYTACADRLHRPRVWHSTLLVRTGSNVVSSVGRSAPGCLRRRLRRGGTSADQYRCCDRWRHPMGSRPTVSGGTAKHDINASNAFVGMLLLCTNATCGRCKLAGLVVLQTCIRSLLVSMLLIWLLASVNQTQIIRVPTSSHLGH